MRIERPYPNLDSAPIGHDVKYTSDLQGIVDSPPLTHIRGTPTVLLAFVEEAHQRVAEARAIDAFETEWIFVH